MKTIACMLLLLAATLARGAGPLVEFVPRAGTPSFLARAQSTNAVRLGYLGGSITAADGWRPKSRQWFQQQFPRATFSEINAAIGGTGSDLGVFRLRHDVLDHKPDLIFVEFAVNDGGAAPENIHRHMEGIVRQTWRAFPGCDIVFVYTIAGNMLETTQQGKLPRSVAAMEDVAAHYGIPSINFGLEIARLEQEGKLIFKGSKPTNDTQRAAQAGKLLFSTDGVHPLAETGHELYRDAVARAFSQLRQNSGTPAAHALKAPLRADNSEHARMVPITPAMLQGDWQQLDATNRHVKSFGKRVPSLWRADQAGASIHFKFRGTTALIYDLLGPDCGQVRVTMDGKTRLQPRFDSYSTYHRLATLHLGSNLSNTTHEVTLAVDATPFDKAKILAQRNEKMEPPTRFTGTNWFVGAILLDGEMIP